MGGLPSKNFIVSAIVLVLLASGWIAIRKAARFEPISNNAGNSGISAMNENESGLYDEFAKDSDKDGLRNWEEALWNTDTQNPDSDGDGTNDGDEIKAYRNPALAGPNDSTISQKEAEGYIQQPKTLSEEINNQLNAQLLFAGGDAESLSKTQTEEISGSVESILLEEAAKFQDAFTSSDIVISARANLRGYANNIAAPISSNFKYLTEPEIDIARKAAETQNFANIKKLESYITAYQKTLAAFKKEPVPSAYANLHVELINIFYNTERSVNEMKLLETDPMRAMVGVQVYRKQVERAVKFFKNLKAAIDKEKIVFAKSESGAFFNQYFEIVSQTR